MSLIFRLAFVAVTCIFVLALAQEPANSRVYRGNEKNGYAPGSRPSSTLQDMQEQMQDQIRKLTKHGETLEYTAEMRKMDMHLEDPQFQHLQDV